MEDVLINGKTEEVDEKDEVKAIIRKYDEKKKQRLDDVTATQTVICLLIAISFFVANIFNPNLCKELLDLIKCCIEGSKGTYPNILDWLP